MSPRDEVTFTGKPTDIDLLAAACQFEFILNADDYSSDSERIAFFLQRCRGPAMVWAARYLDQNPGLASEPYGAFLLNVKNTFGYDDKQAGAIARAQLSALRHTGTLIEFVADFDDCCGRADIHADEPRITMILDKLKPRYRQVISDGGVIPERYASLRKRLLNMSAMEGEFSHRENVQESSRGKRGTARNRRTGAAGPRIKIEPKN